MEPAQKDRTPFSDIDGLTAQMSEIVLDALTAMGRHPEIQRVRDIALAGLRPTPGQRLLDAGSGSGEVARALAARVAGASGGVLAVDHSSAVTAAAISRHDGSNVRYLTGDAGDLDLPDNHVDGVWCERLLQHVDDADTVIRELLRVTRPGGRICLIDTDWGSLAFDGMPAGLADLVLRHVHGHFTPQQHDMGRTLRRRLVAAGVRDLTATPFTCFFATPESAAVVLPMVNPDVPADAWATPPGLREEWLACVEAAGASGTFLAVLTIWVVAGSTPR
ncbi:methyltransferase domain-containing protein [Actinoplanes couchii]|uniref:Methyltransferase type 11 n=1 Tax=Actinoplanes couchii TaxID=403638 RepID=A0ABQ3X546_9ACTN|nr:methyltransferase domain-containing protein [Actinoplanes couchii]MDR6326010.1 SAM-dependent methyltransferase [Actinoplanes couchii]GID53637.1 methyltransferase type 11 [Actinoplanes couchii]